MKTVVLLSGGVDSTTCLALVVDKYGADQVWALTSYYGQKHVKEMEAAKKIAAFYGVRQIEQDLSAAFAHSDSSLLAVSKKPVPHASYDEQLAERGAKLAALGLADLHDLPHVVLVSHDAAAGMALLLEQNQLAHAQVTDLDAEGGQGRAAHTVAAVGILHIARSSCLFASGQTPLYALFRPGDEKSCTARMPGARKKVAEAAFSV